MDERRFLEHLRSKLVPAERRGRKSADEQGGEPEGDEEPTTAFLLVSVGAERVLVPIGAVEEVIQPPDAAPVPRVREVVRGVFMHRGLMVPLLDWATLMGIPAGGDAAARRVLLLGRGEDLVGLEVGTVHGIVTVTEEGWEPLPTPLRFLSRATRIAGELAGLLDVDAVVAIPASEIVAPSRGEAP